jgi:hypothetical protein
MNITPSNIAINFEDVAARYDTTVDVGTAYLAKLKRFEAQRAEKAAEEARQCEVKAIRVKDGRDQIVGDTPIDRLRSRDS